MRRRLSLIAGVFVLAWAAPALAGPGLFAGVDEDGFKGQPGQASRDARGLGFRAFRITLLWQPDERELGGRDATLLGRAVRGAPGLRPVLAVYAQRAVDAPVTSVRRDQYCSYVRSALARFPRIRDVVIWNEPNKSFFWRPQFNEDGTSAAPAAYEALLARCWDALHSLRSTVNVIAPATSPRGNDDPNAVSNVSHSPGNFIMKLGAAYRASRRQSPIFDTIGHHAHGLTPGELPGRRHAGTMIAEGDYAKLVDTLGQAFAGTAQPFPGHCVGGRCALIWYLEAGYQTRPDPAKASLYTDAENESGVISDDEQGRQILAGVRLAYCQPYVGAFFNFLLWDERSLAGWQSAPFWVDRTPKGSYAAFKQAISEANARKVDCGEVAQESTPATAAPGPTTGTQPVTPASGAAEMQAERSRTSTGTGTGTTQQASTQEGDGHSSESARAPTSKRGDGVSPWAVGGLAALGAAGLALALAWRSRRGAAGSWIRRSRRPGPRA